MENSIKREIEIKAPMGKVWKALTDSKQWHPFPVDESFDYSKEPMTLVEFELEATKTGTLLKVTESGFNEITASRRAEAFKMHKSGWEEQLKNIGKFVVS